MILYDWLELAREVAGWGGRAARAPGTGGGGGPPLTDSTVNLREMHGTVLVIRAVLPKS